MSTAADRPSTLEGRGMTEFASSMEAVGLKDHL